jgi:hypothetical protein
MRRRDANPPKERHGYLIESKQQVQSDGDRELIESEDGEVGESTEGDEQEEVYDVSAWAHYAKNTHYKAENIGASHENVVGEGNDPVGGVSQAHHLHHSPELELFFVNNVDQNHRHGQLNDPDVKQRAEEGGKVEIESVFGFGHLLHRSHLHSGVQTPEYFLQVAATG